MRSSSIGRQKQRQAEQRDHLGQNENRSIAVAGMPPQATPEAVGNKDRHRTPQEKREGRQKRSQQCCTQERLLHCTARYTRTCESKGEISLFMSMFARTRYLRHCMRRWTPACEDIGREEEV